MLQRRLTTFTKDAFSRISGLDVNVGLERSKRLNERFTFDYGFGLGLTAMNFKMPGDFFISRFIIILCDLMSITNQTFADFEFLSDSK